MAEEKDHAGSGGRDRERAIRAVVDKAQTGETRKGLTKGRVGVSAPKSPKKWPTVGERTPEKGEGVKAYGPPTSTPPPSDRPRPEVKPDPLKPKE